MRFLLWVALFVFLYSPFFYVGGIVIKAPQVIAGVMAVVGLPFLAASYLRNPTVRVFLNFKFIGFAVVLLLYMAHGANDSLGVQMYLLGFTVLSASSCYTTLYRRCYGASYQHTLLLHLYYVGVAHGLIMIASFLSPAVTEFLQAHFYHSEKALVAWQVRVPGVLFEGFSILSLAQAMTAICGMTLLFAASHSVVGQSRTKILSGLVIILISIMLSGRLGLIVFFVAILFLLMLNVGALQKKWFLGTAASVFIVVVGLIAGMFIYGAESEAFGGNVGHSLELIYNIMEYGEFRSRASDELLQNEYFLPTDLFSTIVGTGNFGRGDSYVESDVGYVIFIFGAGIIGLLASVGFYLVSGFQAYSARHELRTISQAVLTFVFVVFIVNFKDIIFFHLVGFSAIFYMSYLAFADARHRKTVENSFRAKPSSRFAAAPARS
jgi:hypothetical protein